ncbi:hypothetical protein [Sphingomonas yabuuchiae]|uniref:hypothetical protein n=1 Tax=Sphingomonas yabuuchiae TaxID=172044 RepID=UPI003D9590BF
MEQDMAMAYFPRRLEGLLLLGLMSASAVAPASAQVGTPDPPASPGLVSPFDHAKSTPKDAAMTQRAVATLGDLLKGMAEGLKGEEIPATLPLTPQRTAAARTALTEMGLTDGFKPLAEMHYQHALPAMQQASVNLPAAKRQMLFDAMHRAIDTAMAQRATAALDDGARYFATRLSDEDLDLMAGFYAGEVGRQSLHPASQTPENKQAAGRFLFDHPGAVRFEKVVGSYAGHEMKMRQASSAAYTAAFQVQFCRNLAANHLVLPSCPSRALPATSKRNAGE